MKDLVFILVMLAIHAIALIAITCGRRTRNMLLQGLVDIYTDTDVAECYSLGRLSRYRKRYILFTAIVALLGATVIVVPLIIRLLEEIAWNSSCADASIPVLIYRI